MSTGTLLQDKRIGKETESADKLSAAAEAILTLGGITINGDKPWDIHLNERFFHSVMREGSLGLGEFYMTGRRLQVWQFVLSPNGVEGGYEAVC